MTFVFQLSVFKLCLDLVLVSGLHTYINFCWTLVLYLLFVSRCTFLLGTLVV